MGTGDLQGWFVELANLDNPIRREFHLFTLLCGSRPAALQQAKPEHINFRRRTLHIPKPKGGSKRAFDIPLSRETILSLIRVLRFGRQMHPSQAQEWLFPAESASGHLAETKEDRDTLSKWGNDLRQTFRTIATAAGVSEFDAKLLMNHSIPGVNAGYVTRRKLVEDHLRSQQQAISTVMFSALGKLRTEHGAVIEWRRYPGSNESSQSRFAKLVWHPARFKRQLATICRFSGAGVAILFTTDDFIVLVSIYRLLRALTEAIALAEAYLLMSCPTASNRRRAASLLCGSNYDNQGSILLGKLATSISSFAAPMSRCPSVAAIMRINGRSV